MRRAISIAYILFLVFLACPKDDSSHLDPPELAAPANGSTIAQNPPAFIWRAVDETQILYQFEVASDSLFGSVVFKSNSIFLPDTSWTMDSVLTAGTYYWHVCVWEDC